MRGFSLRLLWILLALGVLGSLVLLQRRGVIGVAYEPFAAEIMAGAGLRPEQAYPLSIVNQATLFFRYLATWLVPWPGWMSVDCACTDLLQTDGNSPSSLVIPPIWPPMP